VPLPGATGRVPLQLPVMSLVCGASAVLTIAVL